MRLTILTGVAMALVANLAFAHGDVSPQPVDTKGLPELGEKWLSDNPYRADKAGDEVWWKAVLIGDSGYNQNCARCHGLGAVSGGLAPDLRYLEAKRDGDEWFMERFRNGMTQNGITKMPAFEDVLGQKAGWAIRTYLETRPDDGALDAHKARLVAIRDQLVAGKGDEKAMRAELLAIAGKVKTASGAPKADSAALRAALALDGSKNARKHAGEMLTIGLSAAH